jgi:hypothetical protein
MILHVQPDIDVVGENNAQAVGPPAGRTSCQTH